MAISLLGGDTDGVEVQWVVSGSGALVSEEVGGVGDDAVFSLAVGLDGVRLMLFV